MAVSKKVTFNSDCVIFNIDNQEMSLAIDNNTKEIENLKTIISTINSCNCDGSGINEDQVRELIRLAEQDDLTREDVLRLISESQLDGLTDEDINRIINTLVTDSVITQSISENADKIRANTEQITEIKNQMNQPPTTSDDFINSLFL